MEQKKWRANPIKTSKVKKNSEPAVCSCRQSKSSAWVRSMYCVRRTYCVQLQAQQDISMGQKRILCGDQTVCSCRHSQSSAWVRSIYCLYGDPTVCSCRHSKSSAWVTSLYCVRRTYCVQLQAQHVISMGQKHVLFMTDLAIGGKITTLLLLKSDLFDCLGQK